MNDKCYIISFELKNNSLSLVSAIKSYGTWAKITENTWAVVTTKTAVQVRDHLMQYVQTNERIFVVKSGVEAAWRNAACTNEWLKENI